MFWVDCSNILDIRIFCNSSVKNAMGDKITRAFFTERTWDNYHETIKNLKLCDVIDNDMRPIDINQFYIKTNINLSFFEFMRVQSVIRHCCDLFRDKLNIRQTSMSLIFRKNNAKSKHFRQFLENNLFNLTLAPTAKKRYNWTNYNPNLVLVPEAKREMSFFQASKLSFLPMNFKNFAFKFLNNQLKLNAHLTHIVNLSDPSCSLCVIKQTLPAQKETIQHFFNACPTVNSFANQYFNSFLFNKPIIFNIDWLLKGAPHYINDYFTLILNIEIFIFLLFVFQCRQKKMLPHFNAFKWHVLWHRTILNRNRKYITNFGHFYDNDTFQRLGIG